MIAGKGAKCNKVFGIDGNSSEQGCYRGGSQALKGGVGVVSLKEAGNGGCLVLCYANRREGEATLGKKAVKKNGSWVSYKEGRCDRGLTWSDSSRSMESMEAVKCLVRAAF